ncbi:MAG TPA: Uma2 family endonuclease [Bryobacteraceae bacterium]|nr:Uma2 family endonuclease [Bryobacteraceae bacterium]
MGTGLLVSEQEYLTTTYEPDCEYEDGVLIGRNVGKKKHSRLQAAFAGFFYQRRELWNIEVFTEQRHRIRSGKYMLPDLCVFPSPSPEEEVFTSPPLIWIEILSPDDRLIRVNARIRQILAFGVANLWIVDPDTLESEIHTPHGSAKVEDGILRVEGTLIEVPLFNL